MPKKRNEDQYPDILTDRMNALAAQAAAPTPPAVVETLPRSTGTEAPGPDQQAKRKRRTAKPPVKVETTTKKDRGERRAKTAELLHQHKTRFTEQEAQANNDLIDLLAAAVGTKPSQASVTRALWALLRDCHDAIQLTRVKHTAPRLRRPAKGFSLETADYENELAEYLLKLLRNRG